MRCNVILVSVVVLCLSSFVSPASDANALLAQAAELYNPQQGEFDFVAYEGRLRCAIGLFEQALALLPADDTATRLASLHQLARAYFELAEAYIPAGADQEAAYVAGKDYALAAMRLDPEFVAREATSFRDALASASDVAGVFWYGTNFGSYLNYHQLEAILGGGMRDVPVCYERAMALDETFLAAAPLRSLACFLAQVPAFLGGDLVRARELFDRAIAIAPDYLENVTDLAEWVLKPTEDVAFCAALADVRARGEDPAVMRAWPLFNTLALAQAAQLSADCP